MNVAYRNKSLAWIVLVLVLFAAAIALHGAIDPRDALLIFALCFVCELIDSGIGMGYGTILTPTLLLLGYDAQDIVPTILLSELLSGFTAAFSTTRSATSSSVSVAVIFALP